MTRARRSIAAAVAVAIVVVGIPLFADAARAATRAQGVYRASGKPELVQEYARWLGRPVTHALDYWGMSAAGWDKIERPQWICNRYRGTGLTVELSVAMLPNTSFSLDAGAAGAYDHHWRTFAEHLVGRGCGNWILRLGWEFNGRFYPWAAGGKEAQYAAYWRRIVDTIRSVPGAAFTYDWSPLGGNANADVEAAYPGDDYVDYIGMDSYDTSTIQGDDVARWDQRLRHPVGLAWHRDFAAAHGKPMTYPEWGLTVRSTSDLGGGDNPYYVERMHEWIHGNDVAFHMYFERDAADADHRLMTSQFPLASARYRSLFGGPGLEARPPDPPLLAVAARGVDRACPVDRAPVGAFADVPGASVHRRAVDCLAWWGISAGVRPGSYGPGDPVTRAQMASFLARTLDASGAVLPAAPPAAFGDDDGSAHEHRIDQLAAVGVVRGRSDGTFGPGDPVTRAEVASFLVRAHDLVAAEPLASATDWFTDDEGSVHEGAIDRVAEAGVAAGTAPGRFEPGRALPRDQMASLLARTLDLLVEGGRAAAPLV